MPPDDAALPGDVGPSDQEVEQFIAQVQRSEKVVEAALEAANTRLIDLNSLWVIVTPSRTVFGPFTSYAEATTSQRNTPSSVIVPINPA